METDEFRKEVGKYLLDISKLVFGGVVLASILKIDNVSQALVLIVGLVVSFIFTYYGFKFLKSKKK